MILLNVLILWPKELWHKEGQCLFKVSDEAGSSDSDPWSLPLCNTASWGQGQVGSKRTEAFISLEPELCPLTSNIWNISKSNRGDRALFDLFVNIMLALQGFPALGLHMRSEGSGTRGSHTSEFSQRRTSNVTIPEN